MTGKNVIYDHLHHSIQAKQLLLDNTQLHDLIQTIAHAGVAAIKAGGKIILAGNGGSFADAQHIGAEFTSRYLKNRRPLPAITLGCNASSMSAIGNDYGYDQVFSRELEALGTENDLFLAFSTSGNSPNILNAVQVALNKKIPTFGFTGKTGGKLVSLCTCIQIPTDRTPTIQEGHITFGHIICELIELGLGL